MLLAGMRGGLAAAARVGSRRPARRVSGVDRDASAGRDEHRAHGTRSTDDRDVAPNRLGRARCLAVAARLLCRRRPCGAHDAEPAANVIYHARTPAVRRP